MIYPIDSKYRNEFESRTSFEGTNQQRRRSIKTSTTTKGQNYEASKKESQTTGFIRPYKHTYRMLKGNKRRYRLRSTETNFYIKTKR